MSSCAARARGCGGGGHIRDPAGHRAASSRVAGSHRVSAARAPRRGAGHRTRGCRHREPAGREHARHDPHRGDRGSRHGAALAPALHLPRPWTVGRAGAPRARGGLARRMPHRERAGAGEPRASRAEPLPAPRGAGAGQLPGGVAVPLPGRRAPVRAGPLHRGAVRCPPHLVCSRMAARDRRPAGDGEGHPEPRGRPPCGRARCGGDHRLEPRRPPAGWGPAHGTRPERGRGGGGGTRSRAGGWRYPEGPGRPARSGSGSGRRADRPSLSVGARRGRTASRA